ncbi:MAG: hypothetical protein ABSE62_07395 [Chthoniobacteraceae bacterium]
MNSGARRKESASGCVENWAAALALAALVALHVVYAFVYRVDSDEPQHLHVVWGWVHGLLQYRDIFDNHCPLFQILCAPLLAALGEHSWIMAPMRLAMLPLYAADLSLVYLIGRALYVQRWAIWMAVVAGCVPAFFLVTTEFRTDDLWTTLWLAMLWQAVAGPLVGRRAFLFGLTTGACIAVSMKTALLLASLGTGGVFILALQVLSRHELKVSSMLKAAVLILAGIVIVPGVLIAYFAAHGALDRMYYCIIQHNAVPGLGKSGKIGFHLWLFPLSLPVLFGLGWLCMHSSAHARIGAGRALILIACGAYYFLLRSYWPLVTAQDFTPILPLAALTVLPFLFHLLSLTPWPARVAIPVTAMLLLAGETALVWRTQSPFLNMMTPFEQELSVVLRLTNPGDFVMDGKGESIFRKRPIYWVLEGVTLWRIHLGYIRENVRERIIATGTCVAFNHRLRPEDQTWLRNNFLEGGSKVWVAGKNLGPVRRQINFHTEIGAKYSIVSDGGKLAGTLDGAPLRDSQQIAPGDHRLLIASGAGDVALVWTQALERGFSPFSKVTAGVDDQNL